jgi:hypothetical protein
MLAPDRGWASRLLAWRWRGLWLEGRGVARCVYFVRPVSGETLAWAEISDLGGTYRIDVGSFPNVSAARAGCEADAQRRLRRDREERG